MRQGKSQKVRREVRSDNREGKKRIEKEREL